MSHQAKNQQGTPEMLAAASFATASPEATPSNSSKLPTEYSLSFEQREQSFELASYWLAAIIESAEDAIISKNLNGIITSWNRGAERIFGYSAEEAIGKSILLLIPSDRQSEESVIIGKIKAGEKVEHYETIRQRKDGTLIDIALTVSPVKSPDGTIIGASKIAREITDIKRTAAQLHTSQERYRTLFNSIDEGFCILQVLFDSEQKPVDWRYNEINPAFERQTGMRAALGQTIRALVPDMEQFWFDTYGKVALTGEAMRFVNHAEAMGRWFDVYAFRIGEPEERTVAVLFNDITERERSSREREHLLQQLEAERAKLSYLFTKAPAFVATLRGPDHVFELTNPAYRQLIGHRDVIGKPVREAIPEVISQGFFELLDQVFQTGEAYAGRELSVQLQREPNASPEQRIVDFIYQPLFDSAGAVNGIFVHGIDITEQVQARKAAETANRAKDEFLATLSHELRTPLNAILGWSRMLGDTGLPDEQRPQAIEAIQRNAQLQAQLIEDILDVSRIITGKLSLEVRPTELSHVIEAAVESVLPAAEAKGIRLQRVLDSNTSMVSGDPHRLQQVVWNLLSNAIKFTPKGGRVQVRLERINSHVEIVVSDSGIGIKPEIRPHVFERFRQADSTTTRQYGGLGLGLAIVRHLIEMHGGTVDVESAGENQGATFTVKLPLIALRSVDLLPEESKQREHPTAEKNVPFDCPPELEGIHVLVVDDEEDGRNLVATVLERCGARVTAVSTVEAALQIVQEQQPDVLVSDLGMPGEDGYALIQKVRALSPDKGGRTPAAALTAYARVEDRMRVLRSGFQIHLPKPVEPAELLTVVANLIERHGN